MNSAGTVPAVITAGGRLSGALAGAAGTTLKALAPLGGAPLVAHVLAALRGCKGVGPVALVGPARELANVGGADLLLEEGATGPENVQRGLAAVASGEGLVLLCACDTPFVTSEAIRHLLSHAPQGADIVFPIVTRERYEAVFPHAPNTWTRLDNQELTGGSVMLVRPAALARNAALIEKLFKARKNQIGMARLLGPGFVLRFLLGKLTVAQAEARASQLTGCRCRALLGADPRLAADIDDLSDYEWAQRHAQTLVEARQEGNAA